MCIDRSGGQVLEANWFFEAVDLHPVRHHLLILIELFEAIQRHPYATGLFQITASL